MTKGLIVGRLLHFSTGPPFRSASALYSPPEEQVSWLTVYMTYDAALHFEHSSGRSSPGALRNQSNSSTEQTTKC